mmetsp:Transcript_14975/g.18529  ORF Transcript_14975/g.18529 Transcript_14975/m.18529 type:complete len:88 (+) Transcript_14975:134-397(+)
MALVYAKTTPANKLKLMYNIPSYDRLVLNNQVPKSVRGILLRLPRSEYVVGDVFCIHRKEDKLKANPAMPDINNIIWSWMLISERSL